MEKSHHFTYEGNLTDDLRSFMCTTLKQAMSDNEPSVRRITKLVGFAIELLDNAQRYSNGTKVEFEWTAEQNELRIVVKNISTEQNARTLKNQAERISSLDLSEIEAEYRSKLMNSDFNSSGGAGLGLLQIMKNGAKNLRINVEEMKDGAWMCVSSVLVPMSIFKTNI